MGDGVVIRRMVYGDDGVDLFFPPRRPLLLFPASVVAALDPATGACLGRKRDRSAVRLLG